MYVPVVDKIQAGGSVRWVRASYDVDSPYGNDTPFSPEPNLDPIRINESVSTHNAAAYLQVTTQFTPRLSATVGGRYDYYGFGGHSRVSPRGSIAFTLSPTLTASASGGIYYQQPAFLFQTIYPGNRGLAPWKATHAVAGVAWVPGPDLRLTAEGYWKRYSGYPVASELPSVSLANIGDTFDVRSLLFKLTDAGRGEAIGVEVYLEKRLTAKLYGQANLSLSRTEHAGLDGVQRPGSFDYPVTFGLTGGYRFTEKWQASTRLSYLSGRPYTPFDESVSAAQRRGVYDLARVNDERAPAYARLDVRVDRTFTVGGNRLNIFAGVQNLFNRRNFGSYRWNRRTNAQQMTEQQGIFPLLGFDWRF
jgi:outer membrane receptor protein involved in Fe transport